MAERRAPLRRDGGRACHGLYDAIDGLSEAKTVAGLVRRLKPILSRLAYYAVTGEGSVLEAREEWRAQYLDALMEGMPAPGTVPTPTSAPAPGAGRARTRKRRGKARPL